MMDVRKAVYELEKCMEMAQGSHISTAETLFCYRRLN
jgi:hypothetical protein